MPAPITAPNPIETNGTATAATAPIAAPAATLRLVSLLRIGAVVRPSGVSATRKRRGRALDLVGGAAGEAGQHLADALAARLRRLAPRLAGHRIGAATRAESGILRQLRRAFAAYSHQDRLLLAHIDQSS